MDIVRSFIQASPDDSLVTLTCPDGQGHVPIHVAAMHGHVSVVELCLALGCDPEQGRGDEVTSALELPLLSLTSLIHSSVTRSLSSSLSAPVPVLVWNREMCLEHHLNFVHMFAHKFARANI